MRSSIISILCLVGATIASPAQLEARENKVINSSLKRTAESVKTLDSTLSRKPSANANIRDVENFFSRAMAAHVNVNRDMSAVPKTSAGPLGT
jgi:hypothetical protein